MSWVENRSKSRLSVPLPVGTTISLEDGSTTDRLVFAPAGKEGSILEVENDDIMAWLLQEIAPHFDLVEVDGPEGLGEKGVVEPPAAAAAAVGESVEPSVEEPDSGEGAEDGKQQGGIREKPALPKHMKKSKNK